MSWAWRKWTPWAGWLAAAILVAIGGASLPYTVDDAFVVARYARSLARGLGWNAEAGPPTDGVTGPLAILPGLVAELLGADPVLAAKLVGISCGAAAAAAAARAAARRALGGPSALAVAVLASANTTLGIWSAAGLETGMAALASTVAVLSVTARPVPRAVPLGLAIAALAWLRPECALLGAGLLVACATRQRRAALIAASLAALGALGVVAFRLALFGHPLPLAWDAKPGEVLRGAGYVARGSLVVTGVGGIGLAFDAARQSRSLRAVGLALLAHVAAVALAGGDWMPGFRLLSPIVPAYALLAGIGGARAIALVHVRRRRIALVHVRRRRIALVALALAIGVPGLDVFAQLPRAREAGEIREQVGPPLARALAALAGGSRVALVDVGYLPWIGGFSVLDLSGITDPTIGRRPGRHLDKNVEPELLAERGVGVLVLRSFAAPRIDARGGLEALAGEPVERRLAASGWVRERFRVERVVRWSESYYYVVMVHDRAGAD
jgi:hypothetical protein